MSAYASGPDINLMSSDYLKRAVSGLIAGQKVEREIRAIFCTAIFDTANISWISITKSLILESNAATRDFHAGKRNGVGGGARRKCNKLFH